MRYTLIFLVACLTLTGCKQEPEPTYLGKSLSAWVSLAHDGDAATRQNACLVLAEWDKTTSDKRVHQAFSGEIKANADAARGKENSVSILGQGGAAPKIPTTSYFSDDDGKTWYIDENTHVPPYKHNGKTAYRALLYKCPNGKPFVQRLECFDADSKAKIEAEIAGGKPALSAEYQYLSRGMMIKRPGDTEWVQLKEGDADAQIKWGKVMSATCPDGLPNARPVSVEENAKP